VLSPDGQAAWRRYVIGQLDLPRAQRPNSVTTTRQQARQSTSVEIRGRLATLGEAGLEKLLERCKKQ
jgi:hypothetical protein